MWTHDDDAVRKIVQTHTWGVTNNTEENKEKVDH